MKMIAFINVISLIGVVGTASVIFGFGTSGDVWEQMGSYFFWVCYDIIACILAAVGFMFAIASPLPDRRKTVPFAMIGGVPIIIVTFMFVTAG
ncbi:MAG: hypothetical protein L6Q71_08320 [Planctomycetes bacterium]|nr:hypothetical protein [Planctomycetota bacterium]NUQ34494.1 hypothetical protein [Planctomycetaceae bacterium]